MIPSILAKQLKNGIADYIETTFPMTNAPFRGSVRAFLDTKDAVYHEPYVSVRLPFRDVNEMPDCFEAIHPPFYPHVHQQQAFNRLTGNDGKSTLIATGTGSGKTECFLYPILEYCYQHSGERGIKALIIYPMNALASDQAGRIAKLVNESDELRGTITVGMYVGGAEHSPNRLMTKDNVITDHETLLNNPPDILLTNYKMLDYLLVRPKDAALWKDNAPDTLKYIAVDELHTFDGAQGTDLACLLRRLKSRLWTPAGYLCCIGTSATMGSEDNGRKILDYASEIFGEPFDDEAIITENRLTPEEFFEKSEITDFTLPTDEQIEQLIQLMDDDDEIAYIKAAVDAWINHPGFDVETDEGKVALGQRLMHHAFLQDMITLMKGKYYQIETIVDELCVNYPALNELQHPTDAINALLALISHARIKVNDRLRPFLDVQVQLWMRELRRLLGKVSPDEVTYALDKDLNSKQTKLYLPVVNCRECGATGWTSILNERMNATLPSLDKLYNLYFRGDEKIVMMFPTDKAEQPADMANGFVCPNCLKVKFDTGEASKCVDCDMEMIHILVPSPIKTSGSANHKQYVCPFCDSKRGLALMGLRSATEISASLSQLFASRFNDDKKTLAFSDNVQDAAHRAGFFNARTWKFGLRSAIQRFVNDGGAGLTFDVFASEFIKYWHSKMDDEDFISYFIAPNMTWMRAYEEMLANRRLGHDEMARKLMSDVEKRIAYEIMLEYGLTSRIGRTLEKSGCSCLTFSRDDLSTVARNVAERSFNEIGTLTNTKLEDYEKMVAGYADILRHNGAFDDPSFDSFIREKGNSYMLSNDKVSWMPGRLTGRNTPRFIYQMNATGGRRNTNFDTVSDKKYVDWIAACCNESLIEPSTFTVLSKIILEEMVKVGLVNPINNNPEFSVYGIKKAKMHISDKLVQIKCDSCGIGYTVSDEIHDIWKEAPCTRKVCSGRFEVETVENLDYYGKLYSSGDIVRINAREHTGLLNRDNRETLEIDFKRNKVDHKVWDPNVLSCTPTLEMGIDIGDLSTVILCSMPPAQAQFLQRTGRAGRKDGNALTLAISASKVHDLYFYSDPLDMIQGEVQPPKIFLKASAVLERQFVAYCMDSWVKRGVSEESIPRNIGIIVSKLDSHPADMFPFNFISYVENNMTHLLNSFIALFSQYLDDAAQKELRHFAKGDSKTQSPMYVRLLDAFTAVKKQRTSLSKSIKQLKDMIDEIETKPKDSSYDDELKDLRAARRALINVLKDLNQKNVFNFLSDEGLLPNYAFPETGVKLKAVFYHRQDPNQDANDKQNKRIDSNGYEYNRGASAAISEFAPNNSFYADGRKFVIDQIDLTSAQSAKWRLCPNCSHAQIEDAGKIASCCPRCGTPSWADSGQVRNMLKVQMVYSNTDYTKSLISDDSDDRSNIFYCKQLLVDVDEDNDIVSAFQMDNDEFPFGYEFVRNATLREINFGESDMVGDRLLVSGVDDVRKGFRICKYCGKIQPEHGKANHAFYCKTRKMKALNDSPYEECLFLYREFSTEVLRLLIPATSMNREKTESFVAAFMLGMKEYFGNVDHLGATVSDLPVADSNGRKQYLVIYDTVPGGTGYLKQLMNEKNSLIDIFEKALTKLQQCSCKEDKQKDGCYHCLFAYRQSHDNGKYISRRKAIQTLESILSGKENLTPLVNKGIGSISAKAIFDSELEAAFIEALRQMNNDKRHIRVDDTIINGKHCFMCHINDRVWEIEPQVLLDETQSVEVTCKPDFVIRPLRNSSKLPVAVFTDGFVYHNVEVDDDTLKREAIRRSGRYIVWSLGYHDVHSVSSYQGDYYTPTLSTEQMPSGKMMFQPALTEARVKDIKLGKLNSMELLVRYLEDDDAERVFKAHARGIALSLLEPTKMSNTIEFSNWSGDVNQVEEETQYTDYTFVQPGTLFGTWIPSSMDARLRIYSGIIADRLKSDKDAPVAVCAVLDDSQDTGSERFKKEWYGFWQFANLMQFNKQFIAVSRKGIENYTYSRLKAMDEDSVLQTSEVYESEWVRIINEELFDDDSKDVARRCDELGIPVPEDVGYEAVDDGDEVVAVFELSWTSRKIAYLTAEQFDEAKKSELNDWILCTTIEDIENALKEG